MAATIRKIESTTKVDEILNRDWVSPVRSGYVEIGEPNICLPVYYEDFEETIRNFKVYDDDVFIMGFPKSGTTWTQEMVWLILNDLNFEQAQKELILLRSPLLEMQVLFDLTKFPKNSVVDKMQEMMSLKVPGSTDGFSYADGMPRPRLLKSHLHWSILPEQIRNESKKPKIIIPLRSPADACVSHFYNAQARSGYKGTFEDFCELFLNGRVPYAPFWKTVLSYWERRGDPNVLFIKFKEMKQDLPGVIRRVAEFLGKSLDEEQISKLTEHLSFKSMSKNESISRSQFLAGFKEAGLMIKDSQFVRSGQVGEHKKEFSPEMAARFEAWIQENLAGTGLTFD